MTPAHHEAWEQILSVAKNAALSDGPAFAARYLADGGHDHVVRRIEPTWLPTAIATEPEPAAAPALEPATSATTEAPGASEETGA